MAFISRHNDILKILQRLRKVNVQELTERLNVSEVTIRKDLTALEEMGALIRTRGGAVLAEDIKEDNALRVRKTKNLVKKDIIAKKATDLVKDGDTIYIDAGSTCALFAKELKDKYLRVITNSIDVMYVLADAPGITLFSAGGTYRKEAGSFFGPIAIETVKNFQIESSFLGSTAFSKEGVFSSQNIIESQLKKQIIQVSSRKIVLADSSKYGKSAMAVFARAEDIDILVTDNNFKDVKELISMGIEVLCAGSID